MVKASAAGYSSASNPPGSPTLLGQVDPESSVSSSVDPFLSSAISLASREAVFPLVQRIKHEVETVVDTALSWEQLKSPTINFSLIRPLTVKFSRGERPAISLIYSVLLARTYFNEKSEDDLAFAAVNSSRADLCELLAIKLLSAYGTAPGSFELLHVLSTTFNPFAGATVDMFLPEEGVDEEELSRLIEYGEDEATNALELGIFSKAKRFVKSALVQQVIKAIYKGDVIYSPESNHALIQDDYKRKPVVELYDWRKRPFLDHHRLRVPRIRTRLEFISFAIMLVLFLVVQTTYHPTHLNFGEILFIAWGLGFAFDEWLSISENGLTTYFGGAFNVLDSMFVIVFAAYLGLRIAGLRGGENGEDLTGWAMDTLSLGGCVLLPRVTISLLKDNVVLLALSKMFSEFVLFMGLTVLTASGFLVTLRILSHGKWDTGHISWLLLRMHLGSAFLGFDAAQDFHPIFGPSLMVVFAVLSQTLLLTILISLLTNTFSAVQANAETEILYQKALRTVERAKADPLALYVTPCNIIALVVLFPLRFVASSYVRHKAQVYLARILNLPILLFLALHTRATYAKRSPLYLASQRTQRARRGMSSFLEGVVPNWEGGVELLAERVFEREVSGVGRRVASMDDGVDGGAGGSVGSSSGTRTPTASAAVEAAAAAEAAGKGKSRSTPVGTPVSSPAKPSASAKAKSGRTGGGGDRLGSLTSPLARIFGASVLSGVPGQQQQQQAQGASSSPAAAAEDVKASTSEAVEQGQQGLQARLDRIEEALQLLLGEVVKNGGGIAGLGESQAQVPLTSLTGERETSYAD
ncbi:hypothetical protein JCM6882_003347 [Rhodosporidiobolus microsporus]